VCGSLCERQCAAVRSVRRCVTVHAAVCGGAQQCGSVQQSGSAPVCGNATVWQATVCGCAHGSVWLCARQCVFVCVKSLNYVKFELSSTVRME
jgi:hypothetical protein